MMTFSPLVERIAGEAADAWGLHTRAKTEAQHNPDVLVLSVGDPDQASPKAVCEAAKASLDRGRTHYTPALGEPSLRERVAQHYRDLGYGHVGASNIAIVSGTQAALFSAAMCVLSPEHEVIVPEPMYVTYPGFLGASGVTTVEVSLRPDEGFRLDVEDVAKAISPRTQAILINSPNNPTGSVIAREELEALAELCLAHDIWLIADEVYNDVFYNGRPPSALSLSTIRDRTIVASSLSKSHAMTGWRLGWLVAPEALIAHVGNLLNAMVYGTPPFIQDAAVLAFDDHETAAGLRATYAQRRDFLVRTLNAIPKLRCDYPEGGMFVMLDIRQTGMSTKDFCEQFYEHYQVSLLAADAFGPTARGFLRVSLTLPIDILKEACQRLRYFLEELS